MEDPKEEMESVASSPATTGVYTKALAMVGITTGYIFGPIILFGGVGYFISQALDNRIPMFLALLLSFGVSNWLIFKHTHTVIKKLSL